MKDELLLIDVYTNNLLYATRPVKAETLEDYYELLNCRCIDIVSMKIGNQYYSIICDDEGLLKENNRFSIYEHIDGEGYRPLIAGNVLISKTTEEGETIGLTKKEIKEVAQNIRFTTMEDENGKPIFQPLLLATY